MTAPIPRAWRRLTKADLYLQTAQQAEVVRRDTIRVPTKGAA